MIEKISSCDLEWIGTRFLDPIGKVFFKEDFYYRAIYIEKVDFVKMIIASESYAELVKNNLIPEVEVTNIDIEGFGMVLKTRALDWKVKPSTMPAKNIKKAVINWIRINQILSKDNLCLIDAHFGNIALDEKSNPVWVDFGSIQPLSNSVQGFAEFIQRQLNPLFIFSFRKKLNRLTRLFIDQGVSVKEAYSLIGYFYIRYNLAILIYLFGLILKRLKKTPKWYRKIALITFLKITHSLNVEPRETYWSKYRVIKLPSNNAQKLETLDSRSILVINMVNSINPRSVIDIGANDGYFLSLIARSGMKVIGIEPDEQAINKFVKWVDALSADSNISACVCIDNFYTATSKAELVLGLALTHHLALTDKFKFDFIAKRFSEMTTRALLVEFMPNGMGGTRTPDYLPPWYSLDIFISELHKYFSQVQIVDYDRPVNYSSRIMIYCDGKKSLR